MFYCEIVFFTKTQFHNFISQLWFSLLIFEVNTWINFEFTEDVTEDDVIEPIADYPSNIIDICRPRDLKGHITIRQAIAFQ